MIKAFRVAMATAITAAAVIGVGSASANVKATQFATGFQVVNLSQSDANITISFYAEGSGTAAATFNDTILAADGQKTYANLPVDIPSVPEGFLGGAVVSSDQEVAAITNVIGDGNFLNGAAYSGVGTGATEVLLPIIFKNQQGSAYDTFVNVQNTGTEAANVTITYSNDATETATVQPGSSARFDQATNADLPDDFFGSATVTSDQPVAAAVIQNGQPAILGYNGFTGTSTSPVFPLVIAQFSGDNPTFFTGIAIQNAGDAPTDVTVSYTPSGDEGTACTETQTIPAGESAAFGTILSFASEGANTTCNVGLFTGSAQVTANSADQPLVGVVNQLNSGAFKGGAYNSYDASEATDTIVLALVQDRIAQYFTGVSIINLGDAATTVECVYSNSDVVDTQEIAPGGTWTFNHFNRFGEGFNSSGICTASSGDAQLVGVLNQVRIEGDTDSFFVSNTINN